MELSTNGNRVTISGNIKSLSDFQTIKNSIDSLVANQKSIVNYFTILFKHS